MKQEQGKLFIVSGPSGVGKTTIVTEFLKNFGQQYNMSRVVTYTTKTPRMIDVHGVDYHFIEQVEFERKVESGFFLEWSREYGAYYGTPVSILDDMAQGACYILVIDRIGAAQIVQKYSAVVLIWVQVSSINLLFDRLKSRRSESFEQIQARLFLAKKEIEEEMHAPMYHYYIDNNDLKAAVQAVFEVVANQAVISLKDIK